jgi:hypothetical protein
MTKIRALAAIVAAQVSVSSCNDGATEPEAAGEDSAYAECRTFDGHTAAIAAKTVECLATIGPGSFALDGDGYLRRGFERCERGGPELTIDIDSLLSVQAHSPAARRCIADQWRSWRERFVAEGARACPEWQKLETINAPTMATIQAYVADPAAARDPLALHENYLYRVSQPGNDAPAALAAECAAGFPGFVIEASGDRVLGDPPFWLIGTVYPPAMNPFLTPGYCHLMSFAGPLPGALFGHANRAGECCTRYVDGYHFRTRLVLGCLDFADPSTCVSYCAQP